MLITANTVEFPLSINSGNTLGLLLDPEGGLIVDSNGLAVSLAALALPPGTVSFGNGFAVAGSVVSVQAATGGGLVVGPTGIGLDPASARVLPDPTTHVNGLLFSNGTTWTSIPANQAGGINNVTVTSSLVLAQTDLATQVVTPTPATGSAVTIQLGTIASPLAAGTEFTIINTATTGGASIIVKDQNSLNVFTIPPVTSSSGGALGFVKVLSTGTTWTVTAPYALP